MRTRILGITLIFLAALPVLGANAQGNSPDYQSNRGLYALFHTSEGNFACRLFEEQTYRNVRNFLDLALGYKVWRDPRTGEQRREPYYDDLPIYHVVRNAMIVGGDPLANGLGSPGYYMEDEIRDDLTFDEPGRLAMANLGGRPDTNSGTWFVTVAPLPELNGTRTIIGEVVEGMDVVRDISRTCSAGSGAPDQPVVVDRIDIVRVLSNGQVVRHERSTARPFAEAYAGELPGHEPEQPTWGHFTDESGEARDLPPLPPIYGPLPEL